MLAILEDAETVTFPSGMAAIAAVLYSSVEIRRPHLAAVGRLLHGARFRRKVFAVDGNRSRSLPDV